MQADVFTRFHVTLSDHFSAFVKGIYLSLPDGVSGQRFNWDLSHRFREVFPLRYIYDPLNRLCKLQTGKENLAPEHRSGSTGEQVDLLILLNRVGCQIEEGKQRLVVLPDGVDGYLNDDLLVDELSRLFGGHQGETHEVTRRILAMLLTFLESPDSRNVYTVGTMNPWMWTQPSSGASTRPSMSVFLMKGERRALLQGLLRKFGIELPVDETVVTASRGLVGAEMERALADLAVEGRRRGMAPSPLELVRIPPGPAAPAGAFPGDRRDGGENGEGLAPAGLAPGRSSPGSKKEGSAVTRWDLAALIYRCPSLPPGRKDAVLDRLLEGRGHSSGLATWKHLLGRALAVREAFFVDLSPRHKEKILEDLARAIRSTTKAGRGEEAAAVLDEIYTPGDGPALGGEVAAFFRTRLRETPDRKVKAALAAVILELPEAEQTVEDAAAVHGDCLLSIRAMERLCAFGNHGMRVFIGFIEEIAVTPAVTCTLLSLVDPASCDETLRTEVTAAVLRKVSQGHHEAGRNSRQPKIELHRLELGREIPSVSFPQ